MASVRSTWKGYLKLALVSCPIALYPATSSNARVKFNQLNRATGNRLKQQMVDSVTGEIVEAENKAKGYEIGKDEYLVVEDAEIEAVKIESSRIIEIDSFVPRDQIDVNYLDSPYYLAPDGKVGQDAFAIIRDAMKGKDMVGIGRVVLSSRERPIMLEPYGKGLRALTLRYPYEVRAEDAYFEGVADVKVPADLLQLAETILDSKRADFDPSKFVDRYEDAVVGMLNAKKAGQPVAKAKDDAPNANVVSLMDALRASIGKTEKPVETSAAKPATGKKKKAA